MLGPGGLEKQLRGAILIVLVCVIVIAPLIGCFVFSPFFVAMGIQPYPFAAAIACMLAEALTVAALVFLVIRSRRS